MLQFVGLHEINGPLVVLDGVPSASFEEMVSLRLTSGETRFGRIVELMGGRAVIQVFEGTRGMSLENTKTTLLGHPMEMPLSPEAPFQAPAVQSTGLASCSANSPRISTGCR